MRKARSAAAALAAAALLLAAGLAQAVTVEITDGTNPLVISR